MDCCVRVTRAGSQTHRRRPPSKVLSPAEKFYKTIQETLKCIVCHDVYTAPLECSKCSMVMCQKCHADMVDDKCPVCRTLYPPFVKNPIFWRPVREAKCPFCDQEECNVEECNVEECNVEDCVGRYIRCEHCDDKVYSSDYDRHCNHLCVHRPIPPLPSPLRALPALLPRNREIDEIDPEEVESEVRSEVADTVADTDSEYSPPPSGVL